MAKIRLPSQKGFDLDREIVAGEGLSGRFIVPPFSILRTSDKDWLSRRRQWLKLGINSEVGRNDLLLFDEKETKKYYYVHQESGALWCSDQDMEEEGNPDGCTEQISYKTALKFQIEYGLNKIPFQKHKGSKRKNFLATEDGERWQPGNGLPIWQNTAASIFDPVLCEIMYSWFCPVGGQVVDPFAGGSVRGIVANYLGLGYWGSELRPEQVSANLAQENVILKNRENLPVWVCGDAFKLLPDAPKCDFLFTCPPYGDLEVYSDLEDDLSNKEYNDFIVLYRAIIKRGVRKLKNNRFACFVVTNFRDKKTGFYHDFVGDTVRAFEDCGMHYYNECVLQNAIGSLPLRAGKYFAISRKVGRMHQNILVFYKGGEQKEIRNVFNKEI